MTNAKIQMTKEAKNTNSEKKYDLEERTAKFGESVIIFYTEFASNHNKQTLNKPNRSFGNEYWSKLYGSGFSQQ